MSKTQTIAEIKKQLSSNAFTQQEVEDLKQDNRIGVQRLIEKYERQQVILAKQKQMFNEMLTYEKAQYQQGKLLIAGVDEVGRGPLAGPVVAAAVILDKDFYLPGLNDSKQLSKNLRNQYCKIIKDEAISYGLGILHNDEIDRINIYQASKKAMKKAIQQLNPAPEHVLIDAVQLNDLLCSSESIIKGDQKSVSIAAASVLAKVTRDEFMESLHEKYPYYQFNSNSGYGTKDHLEALTKYGVTPYHRQSFAPIKNIVQK